MVKRMLIDATQPEETRLAVINGKKVEAFEYENAGFKQVKGNIYLAKVSRVEPSLQAAFIEYGMGEERNGFLAFPEVHPDYYRIPLEDREKLLREEQELARQAAANEDAELEAEGDEEHQESSEGSDSDVPEQDDVTKVKRKVSDDDDGGEDSPRRRKASDLRRRYSIQEVIAKRQIMLVQVTKEERGNKGAALTTYLSLPGRYCVLMPNSPQGGGVSRKISSVSDRKKMKSLLAELEVPEGMSVILRTAGVGRTKAEIKRDLDYLLRLWDEIRAKTMESVAPTMIYEEGNLSVRAVRDLYDRDIDEVIVDGDNAYRAVKDFMKLLMPSHAKKVQKYKETEIPLFLRYQIETHLEDIHSPTVQLPSGGYLVINPTEALVAIDVNSGRATKERNVGDTALKTNLEAADEVARQLRLRDLGGLVVVDFIDMDHRRDDIKVERRLKDAMAGDRARVEIGRISNCGLLELSRQRLRPSLVEAHYEECPHCEGRGVIRRVDSSAITILRAIEEEALRGRSDQISVQVQGRVALYLLNQKRDIIAALEEKYQVKVFVRVDDNMRRDDYKLNFTRAKTIKKQGGDKAKVLAPSTAVLDVDADEVEETLDVTAKTYPDEKSEEDKPKRRRRSRGGRNRRKPQQPNSDDTNPVGSQSDEGPSQPVEGSSDSTEVKTEGKTDTAQEQKPKRRRSRKKPDASANGKQDQSSNDKEGDSSPEKKPLASPETVARTGQVAEDTNGQKTTQSKRNWWKRMVS